MSGPVKLTVADRPDDELKADDIELRFRECKECASKLGISTWCALCRNNRMVVEQKDIQIRDLTRKLERLKEEYSAIANAAYAVAGILARRLEEE